MIKCIFLDDGGVKCLLHEVKNTSSDIGDVMNCLRPTIEMYLSGEYGDELNLTFTHKMMSRKEIDSLPEL